MNSFHSFPLRRRTLIGGGVGVSAVALTAGHFTPFAAADGTVAASFEVTATLSHLGQVELTWAEVTGDDVRWYSVHRAVGGVPELSNATLVGSVGAYGSGPLATEGAQRPPAFGDFGTLTDTSYTYVVVARSATMEALTASQPLAIATAARIDDQVLPLVAYAYRTVGGDTVVRWRTAPGSTSSVQVFGGPSPERNPSWQTLAESAEQTGSVVLQGGQGRRVKHLQVVVDGQVTELRVIETPEAQLMLPPELLANLRVSVGTAGSTQQQTFARLLEDLDKPYTEWTYGKPMGPERVTAIKASHAAMAFQITQDPAFAQRAYEEFVQAADHIYVGNADQPLYLGALSTRLAVAYDWARSAWDAEQQAVARQLLNRIAGIWSATHFLNDYRDTKASNWVAITRSGELMVRLALLGTQEYVDDVDRTALVIDEISRNLRDAFGSSGYTQEGLAYFTYPMRELVPASLAMRSLGLPFLEPELARHEWTNLGLHTQSMIEGGHKTQFGVDTGLSSSHQYAGEFVSQTLALATPETLSAAQWHYDHVSGSASEIQDYGTEAGREATLLTYSAANPVNPGSIPALNRALLDDEKGAFFFRNRHEDPEDVLVGTFGRNTREAGWEARETFGLPLLGLGSRWTVMGEKQGNTWRQSKPLMDGLAETATGQTVTLASHHLADQGGGYVEMDASGNYQVSVAHRSMLVDMTERGEVQTVIAIRDTFTDDAAHEWTWQLPIGPGVRPTLLADEGGLHAFVYRREGGWMKGWVVPEAGQQVLINRDKTHRFQAVATTTDVTFRIVLALGRGTEPTAERDGHVVTVAGSSYDLDALDLWA